MMRDFNLHFGAVIGIHYKFGILSTGVLIFVVTNGENYLTLNENLLFLFYIIIVLSFIFIFSYFGQEIHSVSERFSFDLFSSDWINGDLKYKKTMIIFMENLKQPAKFSTPFCDCINLETFQQVFLYFIIHHIRNTC